MYHPEYCEFLNSEKPLLRNLFYVIDDNFMIIMIIMLPILSCVSTMYFNNYTWV